MGCPLSKNGSESDSGGGGGGNTATTAGTAGNSSAGGGGGAGKSESGNKNGEGGGGASAKPADPRLPLNVRQKFNLSKSWKGISREMEMTGVLMFVKLFEENSDLLSLFTKFQELKTRDSQMKSEALQEHATKVMGNLDEMINSLDDMDLFFRHLHGIGALHRKMPGFKKEYFFKMERPFLEAVKEVLQDRYTENMENIYNIIIKLILQTIADGFERDFD
ncbi:hypothetical protein TYRP_002781 [Tyrophagus putrescentiae]|nr:hypothetical protein TYRP_002781 [Tyrophagus putrescentiae]